MPICNQNDIINQTKDTECDSKTPNQTNHSFDKPNNCSQGHHSLLQNVFSTPSLPHHDANSQHESALLSNIFERKNFSSAEALEIINILLHLLKKKDTYTYHHCHRVAVYSSKIAMEMQLNQIQVRTAFEAAILHDIGKIFTPDEILQKPSILNQYEYDIIKKHPVECEKIISCFIPLKPYVKIIKHHHERFDGGGYPDGLQGKEIPLFSRIISIADTFDAITTLRIYANKKKHSHAFKELKKESGFQLDPDIVPLAIETLKKI